MLGRGIGLILLADGTQVDGHGGLLGAAREEEALVDLLVCVDNSSVPAFLVASSCQFFLH